MNTIMKRKESPFTGIWSNLLDQDFFGMPSYEHAVHTLPKVNIIEDNDNYMIELAAPGFQKNNFNIELEDEVLTISLDIEIDAKTLIIQEENLITILLKELLIYLNLQIQVKLLLIMKVAY